MTIITIFHPTPLLPQMRIEILIQYQRYASFARVKASIHHRKINVTQLINVYITQFSRSI